MLSENNCQPNMSASEITFQEQGIIKTYSGLLFVKGEFVTNRRSLKEQE